MGQCIGKGTVKRIVMIGLDGAGKTTLLYRVQTNETVKTNPTIGFNAELVEIDGITVAMWDLGGQVTIRSLWNFYLKDASGLIFVVDSSDASRLNEARRELEKVFNMQELANCKAFLVLANKQDLPGVLKADEISSKMRLEELFSSHDCLRNSDVDVNPMKLHNTPSTCSPASQNVYKKFSNQNDQKSFKSIEKQLKVQNCSAITGEGFHEGLTWLMQHSSV